MKFTSRLDLCDERTMKCLFESYFPRFVSFTDMILKDREASADVVQDVFIRMWKLALAFADETEFKAYAYFALKNASLNYLRDRMKCVDISEVYGCLSSDKTVDFMMIETELRAKVADAIEELPEVRRNIILLRLDGKSYQEISEELGLSLNTVKTHKKLAYKDLKNSLKDRDFSLILFFLLF